MAQGRPTSTTGAGARHVATLRVRRRSRSPCCSSKRSWLHWSDAPAISQRCLLAVLRMSTLPDSVSVGDASGIGPFRHPVDDLLHQRRAHAATTEAKMTGHQLDEHVFRPVNSCGQATAPSPLSVLSDDHHVPPFRRGSHLANVRLDAELPLRPLRLGPAPTPLGVSLDRRDQEKLLEALPNRPPSRTQARSTASTNSTRKFCTPAPANCGTPTTDSSPGARCSHLSMCQDLVVCSSPGMSVLYRLP